MPTLSAGIMLYRKSGPSGLEILLVHPGGPYWAKKDAGSWSIPKGEYHEDEDGPAAAKREFKEETGFDIPSDELHELGSVKYSNKIVTAWAVKGSIDTRRVKSNTFRMEWPPKTGRIQEFAEVDRAGWFAPAVARQKLVAGQVALVDMLCEQLGASDDQGLHEPQLSLL